MAEKILKNRTQFSTTLKNELYQSLQSYSEETGIPMTKILDRAVEMYLNKIKTPDIK